MMSFGGGACVMPTTNSSELRFEFGATPLTALMRSLLPATPRSHVRLRSSLRYCTLSDPPRDRKSCSDDTNAPTLTAWLPMYLVTLMSPAVRYSPIDAPDR